MLSIIKNKKPTSEDKVKIDKLHKSYDIIKNKRFKNDSYIIWKDKDGNNIKTGYYKKQLDYENIYSYVNVLNNSISEKLLHPEIYSFTLREFFDIIYGEENNSNNADNINLVNFAKESLKEFGKFKPGSFLNDKVKRIGLFVD